MSGEYNTFIKFIESNYSFSDAIESKEISLDFNVTIELILLYLRTRFAVLSELKLNNKEVLEDIIMNNNYQIIDNQLIYNGEVIELKHLLDIVRLVKEQPNTNLAKVYYFKQPPKKEEPEDSKLIHFPGRIIEFVPSKTKSYDQKSREYNATYVVDEESKSYIRETKNNFKSLMDKIIEALLNDDLNSLNKTTLRIISGLLDIYSLHYLSSHNQELIGRLNFPIKKIGIGEIKYDNQEIQDCERQIEKLKKKLTSLMQRRKYLTYAKKTNVRLYQKLEMEENSLSLEIMNLLVNLSELREQPSIYNINLINNIIRCIERNHVEVSTKPANPRITFFNVEKDMTNFHATMNLDTFTSILDKDDILSIDYHLSKKVK